MSVPQQHMGRGREGGEHRKPYGDLSQGDPILLPLAVLRASVGQPREPQGEGSLRCNLRAGARHRRRDTDRGPQFRGGLTSKARLGGQVKVEPVRSQGSQMNNSGTQERVGAAGTEWARAVDPREWRPGCRAHHGLQGSQRAAKECPS